MTPSFDSPPYMVSQPVWRRNGSDTRSMVVHEIWKVSFWWVALVSFEHDPGEKFEVFADKLTGEPPALHAEHGGIIYFTETGRAVRSIQGGLA